MNSDYFDERYKIYYAELDDEPTSLREVHAIRLAMEDERVHLGLSQEEWTEKMHTDSKKIMETYGLSYAKS